VVFGLLLFALESSEFYAHPALAGRVVDGVHMLALFFSCHSSAVDVHIFCVQSPHFIYAFSPNFGL
jgi:hypothetical protein